MRLFASVILAFLVGYIMGKLDTEAGNNYALIVIILTTAFIFVCFELSA